MNINEIAKMAGVSRATVSRYLNNGYISQEKKDQIRKVIEKTGYQPSTQAQMLRTKKTSLVGVILPKINSDSISRMVAGISDILNKRGYQIILANTNNDIKEELKYLSVFRDNQVDGVIFIGTFFTPKHKKMLKEYKVPVVILGQCLKGYPCVYQDDFHAAEKLTTLLIEKGNRLAYIGVTERDEAAGHKRRQGFESAIRKAGLTVPKEWMKEADFKMDAGYEKTKEIFEHAKEMPDSIFCATDNLAIGAGIYLKEIEKKVPEDVQLVGIGDTEAGKLVSPSLTSVHFYYKTSGMEAAKMLADLLESDEKICKEVKMGYVIDIRDSVRR